MFFKLCNVSPKTANTVEKNEKVSRPTAALDRRIICTSGSQMVVCVPLGEHKGEPGVDDFFQVFS